MYKSLGLLVLGMLPKLTERSCCVGFLSAGFYSIGAIAPVNGVVKTELAEPSFLNCFVSQRTKKFNSCATLASHSHLNKHNCNGSGKPAKPCRRSEA